jgi:hypothetical protein
MTSWLSAKKPSGMSPAMAARLTETLWDIGDIVKLIEEWEANGN